MTATAILILAREGKLKLDDEVAAHIPGWPYPGVTIRHLLTHTSGLPDYHAFVGDWTGPQPATNADLITRMQERRIPAQFPAGMGWNYSNTGYAVLAVIVEKASGMRYEEFLRERIFVPAGMTHASFTPPATGGAEGAILTRRGFAPWTIDANLSGIVGDGGVYATAEDLHHFAEAWFSGSLAGELTTEALTPLTLSNGQILYNGVGQGLGWNLKYAGPVEAGPDEVFHTGNFGGFRTYFWREVKTHRTLILIDNRNHNPDELALALMVKIFEGKPWPAPSRPLADAMLAEMKSHGIEGALALYERLKADKAAAYRINERELNTFGYLLLYDNDAVDAVRVFELLTREYPDSFNAFDSLAEGYVKCGRVDDAIRAYETALRLNPGYTLGTEALKVLKAQQAAAQNPAKP
jgi:CubicO group peptidase (beta-lactamase class C family)